MNSQKRRRRRGVILTRQGFLKLQAAKSHTESCENDGICYTLEGLSDRTGLDPDTLTKVLGCEIGVDKRTLYRCFRAFNLVLEPRDYKLHQADEAISTQHPIQNAIPPFIRGAAKMQNRIDWGEAPDVSIFYGRSEELAKLRHSIMEEHCRLVMLLGMGGMGKTYLSVKLAEQIQDKFEFVIWRSLLCTPPISEFLAQLIAFLSNQQDTNLPETVQGRISRLMGYLQAHRCLLVFDQAEMILQSCAGHETTCTHLAGCYDKNYEEYGQLFQRVGETPHQSCVVLTSREKPKEIALLEGDTLPVRVLQLKGLQLPDIQQIFKAKGCFRGSTAHWHKLIDCYAGNPLALKIVATTIQKIFAGSISDFLNQNTSVFGECLNLLEQHFNRLSDTEKEIIKWLAINREPASFSELQNQISPPMSSQTLLEALESLEARCLINKATEIEKQSFCFALQPVVVEYVTDRLLKEIITQVKLKALPNEDSPYIAS